MNNIDINLKNSKFYIVEVRVDDYRDGEHYFNTSDNIFLSVLNEFTAASVYFLVAGWNLSFGW